MSKGSNQKLKMLYLLKILSEKTDESHCLSAQELIGELQKYEVSAERKSIYNDIECLTDFGYDIVNKKAKTGGGYYLASREFELPELKLLVDAVQSSRFITQKKSRELIHKIETLAGPYEAKQLQRQVFVASRIKTENESIYYNVDHIHNAIQDNVPISFIYMEWNAKKEFVPRHNGKEYRVSPWALTWKEENYYLVAFDDEEEKIKHFRVDKMNRIRELEERVLRNSGSSILPSIRTSHSGCLEERHSGLRCSWLIHCPVSFLTGLEKKLMCGRFRRRKFQQEFLSVSAHSFSDGLQDLEAGSELLHQRR